jgi:signal transduction histidine kinase
LVIKNVVKLARLASKKKSLTERLCQRPGLFNLQLQYADDLVRRIADDGMGADASTFSDGKEGHFGLEGMRERAGRIGARLNIVSDATRGTEVCLTVPGKIAFHNGKTPRSWTI